ncbi:MAG: calcium/sodium antiporter [Deltaproteobacteria bacterium]
MTILFLTIGLVLLLVGGEFLVRGASGMARKWNVSPILIGVTIVGMGTSAPELMVSLKAAMAGAPGIAIGNVIGSNIANILLILGLTALLTALPAPFKRLKFDLFAMLAATLVLPIVLWDLRVTRLEGLMMLAGLVVFLVLSIKRAEAQVPEDTPPPALPISALFAVAGLIGVLVGASLLVDSASEIARYFGISEAVIGLTIVAIGTSLPEMATSIVAAMRGQRDIAVGNAIGSNVFNVLAILGATSLIAPIPVDARFVSIDVWVALGSALALIGLLWLFDALSRRAGLIFVGLYVGYLVLSAAA